MDSGAAVTGSAARIIGSEGSITAAGSGAMASNAAPTGMPTGRSFDTGCKK